MKASSKPQKPLQRRDATGHLNPKYAADLRERSLASGRDDAGGVAFFGRPKSCDTLAESLGEAFVAAATTGEGGADAHDLAVPEDAGGPFVITKGRDEFAQGSDPSNPPEATREPFPTALSAEDEREP